MPCSMWHFSSLNGNQTGVLCIGRQTPSHWTTREVPLLSSLFGLPLSLCVFSSSVCLLSLGHWVSVQFSSVTQLCATLCDPMNRSTPGLPVHHHLPEFTQTHIHRVGDAIQPSHPLSSPSPLSPNPSQHQSLFQ